MPTETGNGKAQHVPRHGGAANSIATSTIFLSALPFLALQAIGLGICVLFPEIILALPRLVYG